MSNTVDADRDQLNALGYAQELHRGMGTFSNFAISFSIISILAGGFTSYWIGLSYGGPLVITVGWIVVGIFALFVGMAMGEICSAYPTAGGLYFWSAKLATKNAARWSWFTGWFNFIGQVGVIASVDFALSTYILAFINLYSTTGDAIDGSDKWNLFFTFLIVLAVHGLLNTFSVKIVKKMGDISVWWHVIGVVVIVAVLIGGPDTHQSLRYAFRFQNNSGWHGGISSLYAFFLGFLLAQYTITGFDASAHVSEETKGARTAAPKAIVRSIYVSAIAALVLNLAFLLATPDDPDKQATIRAGFLTAPVELFKATLGGFAVKSLVLITVMGQFFCGLASVTANSRMVYAFSRDGGLPGSRIWHKINPKTRTPTNALWFGVACSAVVGGLILVQHGTYPVAFFALTGIAVVGLYIAYIIPVYLRLISKDFVQGEWNLGKWSKPVGWISVVWVAFISILFFAPLDPKWIWWKSGHLDTANFTGPLVLVSFIGVGLWWKLSAKNWFTGPKVQGTKEELLAIERELDSIGG